jgi:hypothetical protein
MAEKTIMEKADEIMSQFGIGAPLSQEEGISDPTPMKSVNYSSPVQPPRDLPEMSDGFRSSLLENMGIKTEEPVEKQPEPEKRQMTIEEMKIVLQAAKILGETTFAGGLGVNMAGASTFQQNPQKKKKVKKKKVCMDLAPLKEFAFTTDKNAWKPSKNSIYVKPTPVSRLTKGVLKKVK